MSSNWLEEFVYRFKSSFQVYRHNQTENAHQYLKGLLRLEKGKANMERMEEEIEGSVYEAYQHFITKSTWNHCPSLK